MKYFPAGTKVTIKNDIKRGPGVPSYMVKMRGQQVTIKYIYRDTPEIPNPSGNCYQIEEDWKYGHGFWSEDMFVEEPEEVPEYEYTGDGRKPWQN